MCGIAGIVGSGLPPDVLANRLAGMRARLQHRGPDDCGIYAPESSAIGGGLVHTRLSILDLSAAGHQPMSTRDGRFTITFNGEIYNFQELRDELVRAGADFRSHSDTEVLLELYRREGEACLDRLDGMFAFAIWDRDQQTLFLARDPFGIKPLYLWETGGQLAFASEVRALLAAELGPRRVSPQGLEGYLLFGSVQENWTLVDQIRCLPAGHCMTWSRTGQSSRSYWQPVFPKEAGLEPFDPRRLRAELLASVRRHLVADVPVGLFLSGGIDSTALLALARDAGQSQIRTFCIAVDDPAMDEGGVAQRTATHFGAQHQEFRLDANIGRDWLNDYLDALDQPTNDGFNTYCVSRVAREAGAKVVLSGLGGDELFGGYPSFRRIPRFLAGYRWLGNWGRRMLVRWGGKRRSLPIRRALAFLSTRGTPDMAHWAMRGFFLPTEAAQLMQHYLGRPVDVDLDVWDSGTGRSESTGDAVSRIELTRYMRNQLLRDSDVLSMAWGLELRVPWVDRRLFQSVSRIPGKQRLKRGKQALVQAVGNLPDWVTKPAKRGFRFPFDRWIAGEWGAIFARLERKLPVHLETAYRRFSLMTLEHFLSTNNIECPGLEFSRNNP